MGLSSDASNPGGPYRGTAGKRRLLFHPGVLTMVGLVDKSGAVVARGPDVGWVPQDATWVMWNGFGATLIEKRRLVKLPADVRRVLKLDVLPEEWIDPHQFPLCHEAARSATLVALPPDWRYVSALKEHPVWDYTGLFDPEERRLRGFNFVVERRNEPLVRGHLYAFVEAFVARAKDAGDPELAALCEQAPMEVVLGHVLRAVSGGVLSPDAIRLAKFLAERRLVPSRREAVLGAWERWLEHVFARARPMEGASRDLARALKDARADAGARRDRVRRHVMPALKEAPIGYEATDRCDVPEGLIDVATELELWEPPKWEAPPPEKRENLPLTLIRILGVVTLVVLLVLLTRLIHGIAR